MDIRQLTYFISVAMHLNFTEAAKHHYVAQSAISNQIADLESQLGFQLFHRTKRSVQLTSAGRVFLQEAKMIVQKAEYAVQKGRQAAAGMIGALRIGFMGPPEKQFMPELVRRSRSKYPGIALSLSQGTMEVLRETLAHGNLDIAFMLAYDIGKIPEVSWKKVYAAPICAIMRYDHPLANRTKINRSELAHERFVTIDRKEAPGAYDAMLQDCANSGFAPNIVAQSSFLDTVLIMVEAEIGIAVLTSYFKAYANPNLRFINLEGDNEFVELIVSWNKDNDNPSIPLFLSELDKIICEYRLN